jgi:hypothetical protein
VLAPDLVHLDAGFATFSRPLDLKKILTFLAVAISATRPGRGDEFAKPVVVSARAHRSAQVDAAFGKKTRHQSGSLCEPR